MDTYTLLRAFADSWMLLAMTLFFLGMVLYTLRPGSRELHADIASIPLRNDRIDGCTGNCSACACGNAIPDFVPPEDAEMTDGDRT